MWYYIASPLQLTRMCDPLTVTQWHIQLQHFEASDLACPVVTGWQRLKHVTTWTYRAEACIWEEIIREEEEKCTENAIFIISSYTIW